MPAKTKPKTGTRTKGALAAASLLPLAISLATPQSSRNAAGDSDSRSSKVCQSDLSSCPDNGCAAPGSAHALLNQLKRHQLPAGVAKMLDFDDFQGLQNQADKLVGQKGNLDPTQRAKLHGLQVKSGTVSEGDLVQITGFLIPTPHPNTGESVNCNLKGARNNDFHIPFAADPEDPDVDGIVVEMIPQNRPPDWNLTALKNLQQQRQQVLVVGQLLYDNEHNVNTDPDSSSTDPKRFSLFEVHPITQFLVCKSANNQCNPAQPDQWQPLGKQGPASSASAPAVTPSPTVSAAAPGH
jgi:hypothetical protein